MYDYGFFKYASKEEVLEKSARYWNPHKTDFWIEAGVFSLGHVGQASD